MVSEEQVERFRGALLGWSQDNLRDFPWRGDVSPYEVLIAEILLSATLASKVAPVYESLISQYPDFSSLAKGDIDDLSKMLNPLGLQNRRAQALVNLGKQLEHEEFPTTEATLRELPWVDRYGANAVLCFAFDARRPIVDTNVIRIYNRVFGTDFIDTEDDSAWEFAEKVLPESNAQRFNLALLDFGAAICKSANPQCVICPMAEFCTYYANVNERRKA